MQRERLTCQHTVGFDDLTFTELAITVAVVILAIGRNEPRVVTEVSVHLCIVSLELLWNPPSRVLPLLVSGIKAHMAMALVKEQMQKTT